MPKILTAAERSFFREVSTAVAANPFTVERLKLDVSLSGLPENEPVDAQLLGAIDAVHARLKVLDADGRGHLSVHSGEDYALIRAARMFDFFHRHIDPFDDIIVRQVQADAEENLVFSFSRKALAELEHYGFSPADADQAFAICYQIRRAFYFIRESITGISPSICTLRARLWNNIFTYDILHYDHFLYNRMEDFSTLLLGETGTGKGTAAKAIGCSAFIPFDRRSQRFVESFTSAFRAINLSQFNEALAASELFGYRKGAFTGAVENHKGLLACCSVHGAVFLDEIGDVPMALQIKLLQVLQERTFCPLGSHVPQRFSGRVIAATHQPLDRLRRDGHFRNDFYYRLCADEIEIPTLRVRLQENPEERLLLVREILRRMVGNSDCGALAERVDMALSDSPGKNYRWPGNVRELEQAVRRVLLCGSYSPDRSGRDAAGPVDLDQSLATCGLDAEQLLARYCGCLYEKIGAYGEVARKTGLDWRTVKKYVQLEREHDHD